MAALQDEDRGSLSVLEKVPSFAELVPTDIREDFAKYYMGQ